MLRYTVVLLFVAALVSGGALPFRKRFRPDGRIVGGEQVTIEDNPWQVAFSVFGYHTCSGAIISADTIVTAAHCVDGFIGDFEEVISGTANLAGGGTLSTIRDIIVHEDYDGLSNDIALVKLNQPLTFDATTAAITLADAEPAAGDAVKLAGWGTLDENEISEPDDLYGIDIAIVDRAECAADYNDQVNVDETMVCAGVEEGGKDACTGDGGAPLTKDGVLVGLVSWRLHGCAEPGYPHVYANAAALKQWVTDNAGL